MQTAAKSSYPLSQSRFRDGLRCKKLLWYRYHRKRLIPAPDEAAQADLRGGFELQMLSRQCFEEGVAIRPAGVQACLDETRERLEERVPLFGPSFRAGRRHCSVDILAPEPEGDGWQLIAVSGQFDVEVETLHELGFQSSCLRDAGVAISQILVMQPRRDFVRHGSIDPMQFFEHTEVTDRVAKLVEDDEKLFARLLDSILESEPEVPIGAQCETGGDCPLKSHCWEHLPEHSVLELFAARARRFRFADEGKLSIVDVNDDELSEKQLLQKRTIESGVPHRDIEQLHAWMRMLEYPLWFLNFESVATALPLIEGGQPWQQLPFHVSLHRLSDLDGGATQFEFLCEDLADPYTTLDGVLSQIHGEGSIVSFDASQQKRILSNLGDVVPERRAHYLKLISRMVDLQEPFRSFAVHHPEQRGSCSLEAVSSALTEHGEASDEIADTSHLYQRALQLREDDPERAEIFDTLRNLGAWKTQAMVELVRVLQEFILKDAAMASTQSPTAANSPA